MLLKKYLPRHLADLPGRMLLSETHSNTQTGELQRGLTGVPAWPTVFAFPMKACAHTSADRSRQAGVNGQVCEEKTAVRRGVSGQVFH